MFFRQFSETFFLFSILWTDTDCTMYNLQNGYYRKRCLLENIAFSNIMSLCPVRKYINVRQYYPGKTHLPCQPALLSGWFSYHTRFGGRCDRPRVKIHGNHRPFSACPVPTTSPNPMQDNVTQQKGWWCFRKSGQVTSWGFYNVLQDVSLLDIQISALIPQNYIRSHDNKTPRQPSSNLKALVSCMTPSAACTDDQVWMGGCWAWYFDQLVLFGKILGGLVAG